MSSREGATDASSRRMDAAGRGVTGAPSLSVAARPSGRGEVRATTRSLGPPTIDGVDFGLEGATALVTGATRGIGLAIATALAAEGARVVVAARTEADVRRVAGQLGGVPAVADLTTEEGCRAAMTAAGDLHVLVNNPGPRAGTSWADTGAPEMDRPMAA